MKKNQIYKARAQVHGAMADAIKKKAPYSPLFRIEWKKYGHVPVAAMNACE